MNELVAHMGYEYHISFFNKYIEAIWLAHEGSIALWYADLPGIEYSEGWIRS